MRLFGCVGGQAREFIEYVVDQLLSARILGFRSGGKNHEQITGLFAGLVPIQCRRREQIFLQFLLPRAQCPLVGLNLGDLAANLSGLLGGHATMSVKLDRSIRHGPAFSFAYPGAIAREVLPVCSRQSHAACFLRASGYSSLAYRRRIPSPSNRCSSTSR